MNYAQRLVDQGRLHGVSIALVDSQGTVFSTGAGLADPLLRIPASGTTRYRAGSIAKLFTATGIMQLEERHAVDIDQPAWLYLPGFAIGNRFTDLNLITLRNLLTHSGGLPCDIAKGMWSEQPFTRVADLLDREYVAYPPDYVTAYSNVGYSLLGHVIAAESGYSFSEYMERQLFSPLGMVDSEFVAKPEPSPRLARGHRGRTAAEPLPIRDVPALGLVTSANDLAQFLDWVLNGPESRLLMRGTLAQMLTVQNADIALDFDARVGLGWSLDKGSLRYAGSVARHGGNTPLYTAELIALPDYKLAVAVLTNRGEARAEVRYLAETALRIALESRHGLVPPAHSAPPALRSAAAVPSDAAGRYMTELGIIRVDPHAKVLHAERIGGPYPLRGYANGAFGVQPAGIGRDAAAELRGLARLRFTAERINGRDVLVAHTGEQSRLFGDRVPDDAVPAAWRGYLGRYRVVNGDAAVAVEDVALREADDLLFLEYRMPALSPLLVRQPLGPVTDREAIVLGLGRACGDTVMASMAGNRRHLHFSGYDAIGVD
jgi:CubicO group peptidase (beta-lactamase class C family)